MVPPLSKAAFLSAALRLRWGTNQLRDRCPGGVDPPQQLPDELLAESKDDSVHLVGTEVATSSGLNPLLCEGVLSRRNPTSGG